MDHSIRSFTFYMVLALSFAFIVYLCPVIVHLKKVGEEGERLRAKGNPGIRRAVFLADEPGYSLYDTSLEVEILDSKDNSPLDRKTAIFNVAENMDVIMEIPPDYPECFQSPAMPFKLYDENGEWVNHGITLELFSETPDVFQVRLHMPEPGEALDKDCFYRAYITLTEGEAGGKMLFYAIIGSRDMLESMKAGCEVYEMNLYHCRGLQKTMALPASICLYKEDGTFAGDGEVCYYFSQRYLFESKRK